MKASADYDSSFPLMLNKAVTGSLFLAVGKRSGNFTDDELKWITSINSNTSLDTIVTHFQQTYPKLQNVLLHFDEIQTIEALKGAYSKLGRYYDLWDDIFPLFSLPSCFILFTGRAPELLNLGKGIQFAERQGNRRSPTDVEWLDFSMFELECVSSYVLSLPFLY